MIFLKPYCITRPISSRTVLEDAKRITRPVSSRTILEDAFHFFIRHASLSTTPLHIIQSFSLPSQHKPYHPRKKLNCILVMEEEHRHPGQALEQGAGRGSSLQTLRPRPHRQAR